MKTEITEKDLAFALKYIIESDMDRGIWYIEFEKKDGSLREMWCTRDYLLLPKSHEDDKEEKETITKKPSPNVNVFDLDIEAWRSFRPESLRKAVSVDVIQWKGKFLNNDDE